MDPSIDEQSSDSSAKAIPRRSLFRRLTYLVGAAAAGLLGAPLVGYFFGVRRTPDLWVTLDEVDKFPRGATRLVTFTNPIRQPWDGVTAHTGVFVRRMALHGGQADQFQVFAVNCAHLGCPVEWFPESGLFLCPCHGGVYYANGERASGPPPRGLYRYESRIARQAREGRDVEVLQIPAPHYPTLHDPLRPEELASCRGSKPNAKDRA